MNKLIIIAAVIIVAIVYFFLFSPFASKPNLEKPTGNVTEAHIAWLLNELGSYKLHANPLTGEKPEIEVIASKTYDVIIDNGTPNVIIGTAANPDIRITTQDQYILELMNATDFAAKATEMNNEGKISVTVLKSKDALALKGYLALYNEITS